MTIWIHESDWAPPAAASGFAGAVQPAGVTSDGVVDVVPVDRFVIGTDPGADVGGVELFAVDGSDTFGCAPLSQPSAATTSTASTATNHTGPERIMES